MKFLTTINRQLPLLAVLSGILCLGWTIQHHLIKDGSDAARNAAHFHPLSNEAIEGLAAPAKISAVELTQIPTRHLFGQLEKPKAAEAKPIEAPKALEPDFSNLPETRIPLKLSGIAFSRDASRAFAMIITADGKQADYQAGEPIGTEAKVHLIEEKRVVIERDGKFEALNLLETNNASRNRSPPSRATANRSQTRPTYKRPAPVKPRPNKRP